MKSIELGELAVDLRLKYKLDAEMKVENKYPLTVFRSYNSSYVKIRFDNIMKVFHIAIHYCPKNYPKICKQPQETLRTHTSETFFGFCFFFFENQRDKCFV